MKVERLRWFLLPPTSARKTIRPFFLLLTFFPSSFRKLSRAEFQILTQRKPKLTSSIFFYFRDFLSRNYKKCDCIKVKCVKIRGIRCRVFASPSHRIFIIRNPRESRKLFPPFPSSNLPSFCFLLSPLKTSTCGRESRRHDKRFNMHCYIKV